MIKIFEHWKNHSVKYYDITSLEELMGVIPHLLKHKQLLEKIEIYDKNNLLIWPRGKNLHSWNVILKHLK